MTKHKKAAEALLVQKHQQSAAQKKLIEIDNAIKELSNIRATNLSLLDDIDSQLGALMAAEGINFDASNLVVDEEIQALLDIDIEQIHEEKNISNLDIVEVDSMDWDSYMDSIQIYAKNNGIDLSVDPFQHLMTDSQRIEIEKRIDADLTYKLASCDKYDYMIAGTCGMIAGLIDVLFVGVPGEGLIGKQADQAVDKAVCGVAKLLGWSGAKEGSDPTASAIGFLERKFKVNYDQTHSNAMGRNGTGGLVKNLTPKNHHIKNLAHSPDLVGLVFSIINQFTSTSTFVSDGKLVTIDTETFELKGGNFPAKVFCGLCNWLGHIASDMAGSSGSSSRGSGVPIPFYSLLQFLNFGAFGQYRDTFAKVAVKVFEQGYDMRHGLALAVPVLVSELLTRISWTFKQRFYHNMEWSDCIPSAGNPELRRMLLVAHGTLCLVDGVDAGLRSGGNIVSFMLRANILAWARFGTLAIKELRAWYRKGGLDIDAANEYLEQEYQKLLMQG